MRLGRGRQPHGAAGEEGRATKLLVIGLDSGDRDLILEFAGQGSLPVLERLLGESLRGETRMPPGLGNEAMWMTFCTGVNPARHGIHYFEQLKVGSYDVRPMSRHFIKQEPFWEGLSRQGRRVAIVDAPRMPLPQSLNGMQLQRFITHAPGGAILETFPKELAGEILERFGAYPHCPCSPPNETLATYEEADFAKVRDLCLARLEKKADFVEAYLRREPWDLFFVTFAELHCIGHDCWHLRDPEHPAHRPEWVRSLGDPIKEVYRGLDAAIGRILDSLDKDTSVLLFAGPGMGPNYTGNHMLGEILRRLDFGPTAGTQAIGSPRGLLRRVIPQSLRRHISPMLYRLWARLRSGRLRHRRFFPLEQQAMHGAIRINRKGREPDGKVEPGPAFDRLCQALTADLLELTNLETGMPVVREVLRADRLYNGAALDQLPDLLVLWNQEKPIRAISSPKIGEIRMENPDLRSGEHFDRILFALRGPGIKAGECLERVQVEDFAATIAALLGTSLSGIEGSPIRAALMSRLGALAERGR